MLPDGCSANANNHLTKSYEFAKSRKQTQFSIEDREGGESAADLIELHPDEKIRAEKIEKIKKLSISLHEQVKTQFEQKHLPLYQHSPCNINHVQASNSMASSSIMSTPLSSLRHMTSSLSSPIFTYSSNKSSWKSTQCDSERTDFTNMSGKQFQETDNVNMPFQPENCYSTEGHIMNLIDFGPTNMPLDLINEDYFDPLKQKDILKRKSLSKTPPPRPPPPHFENLSGTSPGPVPIKPKRKHTLQNEFQSTPGTSSTFETTTQNRLQLIDYVAPHVLKFKQSRRDFWSQRRSYNRAFDDPWTQVFLAKRAPYGYTHVGEIMIVICTMHDSEEYRSQFTCASETTADVALIQGALNLDERGVACGNPENLCLKVYGTQEYLKPETQLSAIQYVHDCICFDRDILFEIATRPTKLPMVDVERHCDAEYTLPVSVVQRSELETLLSFLIDAMNKAKQEKNRKSSMAVLQCVKALTSKLEQLNSSALEEALEQYQECVECRGTQMLESAEYRLVTELSKLIHSYTVSVGCSFTVKEGPTAFNTIEANTFVDSSLINDRVRVRLYAVCNLPPDWIAKRYDNYFIEIYIYNRAARLCQSTRCYARSVRSNVTSLDAPFTTLLHTFIEFDDASEVTLDVPICSLPRDARILAFLYGHPTIPEPGSPTTNLQDCVLAWTSFVIFDEQDRMTLGLKRYALCTHSMMIQPWGAQPALGQRQPNLLIEIVRTPRISENESIIYPVPIVIGNAEFNRQSRNFSDLDEDMQTNLLDIIDGSRESKPGEVLYDVMDILWGKRHYLYHLPHALALVLRAAPSYDWTMMAQVRIALNCWMPLDANLALELLLPEFSAQCIRQQATDWIMPMDQPIKAISQATQFLPQLVEALRFETSDYSYLASALLHCAADDRRFAYDLYWQLHQRCSSTNDNLPFGKRYSRLKQELLLICGSEFEKSINKQLDLTSRIDSATELIKTINDEKQKSYALSDRMATLDSWLLSTKGAAAPIMPYITAVGVRKYDFYKSLTQPVRVTLRALKKDFTIMDKIGDDVRQDALVLQIVALMNVLWRKNGLDLRILTYKVLPTGKDRGFIEIVPNCEPLLSVTGLRNVVNESALATWLQKHNANPALYEKALENFMYSCAGWIVVTYVLGIGDRHNDNVLLTATGHMLHIDFGKWFGDWQRIAGIARDRVPFLLTSSMAHLINAANRPDKLNQTSAQRYQKFVDLCTGALEILRDNHFVLINIIRMMICSEINGVNDDACKFVAERLMLKYSKCEAVQLFTEMIEESLTSSAPTFNFVMHGMAQYFAGRGNKNTEGLSFQPKIYSRNDGEAIITSVILKGVRKWRDPVKIYRYEFQVEREGVRVPDIVHRSYDECQELSKRLNENHPHQSIKGAPLPSGKSIGRTQIHEVAMRRMGDVDEFISSAMRNDVLKDDNLIYTFFHPLHRDNAVYEDQEQTNSSFTRSNSYIGGELKLRIELTRNGVEVLVQHARNLKRPATADVPSSYVKCCLKSDEGIHCRNCEKKTRIIAKSAAPTFNEVFTYSNQCWGESLEAYHLEVTVWHSRLFLGGVIIPLFTLSQDKTRYIERWFPLQDIWNV